VISWDASRGPPKAKAYRYGCRYDTEPSVRIWRDASGDYIEIEGMDELVPVRRV
jgi:hypothetical protein